LERAWELVRKNRGVAGVDRQSIERFATDTEKYLTKLQQELAKGEYHPLPGL
jgi:RNA-directed DNA polymerase